MQAAEPQAEAAENPVQRRARLRAIDSDGEYFRLNFVTGWSSGTPIKGLSCVNLFPKSWLVPKLPRLLCFWGWLVGWFTKATRQKKVVSATSPPFPGWLVAQSLPHKKRACVFFWKVEAHPWEI